MDEADAIMEVDDGDDDNTTNAQESIYNELRSRVYVGSKVDRLSSEVFTLGGKEDLCRIVGDPAYTQEMLRQCRGILKCYNCNQSIEGRVFLFPVEYKTTEKLFVCSPIPHDTPSCALRTLYDLPNNFDMLSAFFMLYGNNVHPAPPRLLLYVPHGLSLEQYHEQAHHGNVIQHDCSQIRSMVAPSVFTSVLFPHFKLTESAKDFINQTFDDQQERASQSEHSEQKQSAHTTHICSVNTNAMETIFNPVIHA